MASDEFRIPKLRIPEDAAFADLCNNFRAPEEFVRCVLGALVGQKGNKDPAIRVRFLLSSNPTAPHYEIVELVEDQTGGGIIELAAFDGRTHRELSADKIGNVMIWGSSLEGYSQVQQLLGKLRGKL